MKFCNYTTQIMKDSFILDLLSDTTKNATQNNILRDASLKVKIVKKTIYRLRTRKQQKDNKNNNSRFYFK